MWHFVTFILGGIFGIVIMCLASAASNNGVDTKHELWYQKRINDAKRQKRFSKLFDDRK